MEWIYPSLSANQSPADHTAIYGASSRGRVQTTALPAPLKRAPAAPAGIPPAIGAPISAALFGAVIGGANAFGRNVHRVQKGEMTLSRALVRGLMHGVATSLATTTAAVLTTDVDENDALHLVTLAAATAGFSYLIHAGVQWTHNKQVS